MSKKKVAVIGGGTGLTMAWLLAEQFDVTLYEASGRLGGHVQTIELKQRDGTTALVEAGFEFINPNYVYFYKLLQHLGMELRSYDMKMEFIDYTKKEPMVNYEKTFFSPSLGDLAKNYSDATKKCCQDGCCACFNEFKEDSEKIENLALLEYAIYKYNKMKDGLNDMTTKEFIDSLNLIDPNFGPNFFYPFTAASWGIDSTNAEGTEPRNAEDYCALYTFFYLASGNNYQEVVGGMDKYIVALYERIKHICNIKLNCKVGQITQSTNGLYQVQYENTITKDIICDKDYDEVIICTSFEIAAKLIESLTPLKNVYDKINPVTYYTTRICIHESKDEDFNDDMVIHIKHTQNRSSLHITKPWNGNLTRSWVYNNQPEPDNTLQTVYYRHPNMTKTYYLAQKTLNDHNNKKMGVSFGGICAGFNDSHEGAIFAAVNIAKGLANKYNVNIEKLAMFGVDKKCCDCSCTIQ